MSLIEGNEVAKHPKFKDQFKVQVVLEELIKAIDRVFSRYPVYWSRQIVAYLRCKGVALGRHRVRHLMARMGQEP